MSDIRSPADAYNWLLKMASDAEQKNEKRTESESAQLFLPGLEDMTRALPNHINRSSLFAPIARGRRKFHHQAAMVSRADAVISYTGEQLDEADADLMLQLLFDARKHPLGESIPFKRATLLKSMGRSVGKHDYEWLHRRMKALTEGTVFIEAKRQDGTNKYSIGHTKAFHILAEFEYNSETETYSYRLDPRWIVMFDNREYSLLDWEKRLQIGAGQDLAKAIQRLIATSDESPQRYSLEWLKEKMQYTGRLRDFKDALGRAGHELRRLDIIGSWKIEVSTKNKDQFTITLKK